jgi:hypothetical protein
MPGTTANACRCATAFNVKEICLVGSRQFNAFGSHGAAAHVQFRHFPTLEECVKDLHENKGRWRWGACGHPWRLRAC